MTKNLVNKSQNRGLNTYFLMTLEKGCCHHEAEDNVLDEMFP